MKLTNTQCKNAQPKKKVHKLADGGGLYLLVKPNGAKHWRLKYRFLGKEKLLALGPYPLVSLAEARERRDEAKKVLADGKDPINQKQDKKRQAVRNAQNTFKAVALEWHGNQKDAWSEHHGLNVMRRLEIDIFPYIGSKPIADIDAQSLLYDVIKRVEDRKAFDVASRVKQICGQVFRYGIITRKCSRDVSADLKGAMDLFQTEQDLLNALQEGKVKNLCFCGLACTGNMPLLSSGWEAALYVQASRLKNAAPFQKHGS